MSYFHPQPGWRAGALLRGLLALLLFAALVVPAWSQASVPVPQPPAAPGGPPPSWTVVPTAPKVMYAPNIPGDVFLHHKKFFYYSGGVWYQSKNFLGPWRPVKKVPKGIRMVDRSLFKSPPPW